MNELDFTRLTPGTVVTVVTRNSIYRLSRLDDGKCLIEGNGDYFNLPTIVKFLGARRRGVERAGQIVVGLHIAVDPDDGNLPIETSSVQSINVD